MSAWEEGLVGEQRSVEKQGRWGMELEGELQMNFARGLREKGVWVYIYWWEDEGGR